MSTAIWQILVMIGLKTKFFYHYAKFWQDPFLNCVNSSIGNSREAWFHETVLSENANAMLLTYLKLMPEINRHAFYDVYTFH